jgi:hypothetical protein
MTVAPKDSARLTGDNPIERSLASDRWNPVQMAELQHGREQQDIGAKAAGRRELTGKRCNRFFQLVGALKLGLRRPDHLLA